MHVQPYGKSSNSLDAFNEDHYLPLFIYLVYPEKEFSLKKLETTNNASTFSNVQSNETFEENISKIWVKIPFLDKQVAYLVKKLICKVQCSLAKPVKFVVIYQTKNICIFSDVGWGN